jgi:hypothetical protein
MNGEFKRRLSTCKYEWKEEVQGGYQDHDGNNRLGNVTQRKRKRWE